MKPLPYRDCRKDRCVRRGMAANKPTRPNFCHLSKNPQQVHGLISASGRFAEIRLRVIDDGS